MKQPMLEKYCDLTLKLGLTNEMETPLNMSPEGKNRRQTMYQKEKAEKYLEEFANKRKGQPDEKKPLNLTLKQESS